jgi:hypothetical protein
MEATMKSQVNDLLHVVRGIHKDILAAYPEMGEDLERDFERIALLCRDRDLSVFTLDLPALESQLLAGLESGRLSLEGPLSTRKSPKIHVPRLYGGLWLRVFDRDACLLTEVDVTALAFLRQVLTIGKKLRVECSHSRVKAVAEAYHDIESRLRPPTLNWAGDRLGFGDTDQRGTYWCRSDQLDLYQEAFKEESFEERERDAECDRDVNLDSLHLVQALDFGRANVSMNLPLFASQQSEVVMDPKDFQSLYRALNKVQQVADLITSAFDELDVIGFSSYLEQHGKGTGFRHGPGAVAEKLDNWEKSQFPNWPAKLNRVFPFESCGKTAGSNEKRPTLHEKASILMQVPKTAKSPRLIAAEPTSHQWCQQLILQYFNEQCRKTFGLSFIAFKKQSMSGDLVIQASKDLDLATVDLSDASDRLTCWTVERLFRRNPSVLKALHAARTRYLRDEVSEDVSYLKLKKFASQGTATTFPVMSLVMLFIALGVSVPEDKNVTWREIWKLKRQVRVYGDDIILPTHGYVRLCRVMEALQLKVNVAKSYVNGKFRESCGVDGYAGYDITAVKPKTLNVDSPAACQAVIDNSNNLYKKGYWNASAACLTLLPLRIRRRLRIVDSHAVGIGGVTSYSGSDESHLEKRWNPRLHRNEVRVWTLSVRTQEHFRDGFPALLDFFASKHSHEHARTVSEYAEVRKTRSGLLWEPSHTSSLVAARLLEKRSIADHH